MNLIDRIRLPFRKDKESYSRFYKILGFYPHNISYYKKALIHKSVNQEKDKKSNRLENNERLEFLGDAILDAVVGDIVYRHFEGKREGFLTNTRSKIVQRETLNRVAKEIGLNELIQSSITPQSSHNSYMGGNAFEALVGAIYLDRGYQCCMSFMQNRILKEYIDIQKMAYKEVNFKSKLIEWSQKNRVTASFDLVEQNQEENGSPVFVSRVLIEGIEVGSGKGYSKKESQQNASKEAMTMLKRKPQLVEKIFAEKTKVTAMEEEPRAVLDIDVNSSTEDVHSEQPTVPQSEVESDFHKDVEMDLSHISLKRRELTRDEIIAAAEEAAFNGEC